jgi:hypothetical protein
MTKYVCEIDLSETHLQYFHQLSQTKQQNKERCA